MAYGIRDAVQLYGIEAWGNRFFGVNPRGNLTVHPEAGRAGLDLYRLLPRLEKRGVRFPCVLRFPQILGARVDELFDAFDDAIREFEYDGVYRGVFPIKVNQLESVVADLARAGRGRGMGLEAGSKAELAIALATPLDDDAWIICNGYKDPSYIRLALQGRAMGRRVVLIAEKPQEIPRIIEVAQEMGIDPQLGIRIRLTARSSGKWERSSGPAAKFGFTTQELLNAVEALRQADLLHALTLVHFHAGSQITEIKRIKTAVKEGARIYAKLHAEGCRLEALDVGGGLGVDYDGSHSSYDASMNYSVREYVNDVVYSVQEICEAEGVPVPTLISESGRALVAYHSMLITEVRGQNVQLGTKRIPIPADAHETVKEMDEILEGMTRKNHREYLHDAQEKGEELLKNFELGLLSLRDRALGERLLRRTNARALAHAKHERFLAEEFVTIQKQLVTKYIANFSVFQSIPDSWALDQLFPVVPIHRLHQKPTIQATLCDVTCDSDGEVDRFVDLRDVRESLPLHELEDDEPYYVGIFLIGAYQDVLGDYHNLFGRVDEAHIKMTKKGEARIVRVHKGDHAQHVLGLFGHDGDAMRDRVVGSLDDAVKARKLTRAKAKKALAEFDAALGDYTYLEF